jgi:carboxymethylenebutenolidase
MDMTRRGYRTQSGIVSGMGEWIDLSAGNRGYLAVPTEGRQGPGVLVAHAWWGLNDTFKGIADRLAEEGFVALAPDLYGDGRVATTIEAAEAQLRSGESDATGGLLAAGLDALLEHQAVLGRQVGVIGFSMGGYWSIWLSLTRPEVAAVVVFYSTGEGDFSGSHAAYLGHFAPGDEWEPDEGVAELEAALRTAGRDVVFYRYEGAKHWFFEPDRPEYDSAAAELAWTRTIAFLRENLGPLGA